MIFTGSKLYRNGVLEDTGTSGSNITGWTIGPPSNQLTMGTFYPGSNYYTHGAVDELSIFHAVLSDSDVNLLYNAIGNT